MVIQTTTAAAAVCCFYTLSAAVDVVCEKQKSKK
jgi:hypothetical protein